MDNKNRTIIGYLLVIISAIAVSIKGIFAKMLYSYGLGPPHPSGHALYHSAADVLGTAVFLSFG